MIHLLLLGTAGCHLCEQAEELINTCLPIIPELTIEAIDIAELEHWQEGFASRIPVLHHPETKKDLGWPFNQTQIVQFVNELRNG
jgi:hypothetical protein